MKAYLIFVGVCVILGLLPRIMPDSLRSRVSTSLDRLFWVFSLPTLIAFLGFAIIIYIKNIDNLSTLNAFFLILIGTFAAYYVGALASTAGKVNVGSTRCPKHEDTQMVCPECQRESKGRRSG